MWNKWLSFFATKITGGINVPHGEISWKCNLKDQVRICDESEWNGKTSYHVKTKVAYEGFRNPDEINSEGKFNKILNLN